MECCNSGVMGFGKPKTPTLHCSNFLAGLFPFKKFQPHSFRPFEEAYPPAVR
jgi:hypothetical protein